MVASKDLEPIHDSEKLDFVFQLFTSMQKDNLNYIYRGVFSQRIMETILGMAESNIVTIDEKSVIKKRVYHIMVECLQNITRHQASVVDDYSQDASLFILQKKDQKYYITSGNIIEPDLVNDLKAKIEKINSFSPPQLKEYYKQMLVNGSLSEKGGAGLGLIDMARKSGNKLSYHFKNISEDKAFFFLTTEVLTHDQLIEAKQKTVRFSERKEEEETTIYQVPELEAADGLFSIESISELHDLLNNNNIKIIFNNYFNSESLETLLIFLDKQICETLNIDKKVYTLMVELFLNIILHGVNPQENKRHKGNPGLFFIREIDGQFAVNTSNYITNDKIEALLEKIEYVNNMTSEDSEAMLESMDLQTIISEKGGLGLASIKQITKNKLTIHLCKVDEEYTFLTITCIIGKSIPITLPVMKPIEPELENYDALEIIEEAYILDELIDELEDKDEIDLNNASEILDEAFAIDQILESEENNQMDHLNDFLEILEENYILDELIDDLEAKYDFDFENSLEIIEELDALDDLEEKAS